GQPQAFWGRTSKPPTPGMRARRAGPRRERDHRACDDKENPMSLGRPCLLLLTFCLALAWVAPVAAVPLVTFHDLNDTVTAEGSGTAIPLGNELIEFSLSNFPPSGLKDSFIYIIEGGCTSGTCPVSDVLQVISGSGGALPLFVFVSDA